MSLSKEAVALLKNNAEEVKEILYSYADCGVFTITAAEKVNNFLKLHTTEPVRFKDFHGNEVAKGSYYWFVMEDYALYKAICDDNSGQDSLCTYFSTEQAAKDWIELNKPCLSVQDVLKWKWLDIDSVKVIYKSELLEIIRKKS